jgi:hypothetical protein
MHISDICVYVRALVPAFVAAFVYTNGKKKLCIIKNNVKNQYPNKIYVLCTGYC